ncbi:hypothetical protein [Arthrobacter sedimenti]|uniref:hypothetical protein n=1 Tax=Arthrobacter sedimenti TaxID=2694931 RepID=UPI0014201555|nr:hypothetical protein [Arthrobacter sedimenti]
MPAGNWPVLLLQRGYREAWQDLSALVADTGLSATEPAAVHGGSAIGAHRLHEPIPAA